MIYPFIYSCRIWNDIDEVEEMQQGCTFAESWAEAMKNVEAYYGDELINCELTMLEDASVLELSEAAVKDCLERN